MSGALTRSRVRGAWLMAAPMLAILLAVAGWPLARTLWLSLTDATLLQSVRQQASNASAQGIQGVPHFQFGTRAVHGAQPPEALLQALTAYVRT